MTSLHLYKALHKHGHQAPEPREVPGYWLIVLLLALTGGVSFLAWLGGVIAQWMAGA